jgi:hypothetical protein
MGLRACLLFLGTVCACSSASTSGRTASSSECRGPGRYEAGKEGSYRPCCEGLHEFVFAKTAAFVDGVPACVQPLVRVYACVRGTCGDGVCEPEESAPCGCTADCQQKIRFARPEALLAPRRREAGAAAAERVFAALEQASDRSPPSDVSAVDCHDIPISASETHYRCAITYRSATGPNIDVSIGGLNRPDSARAHELFDALHAAGAQLELDKVARIRVRRLNVAKAKVVFDDEANIRRRPRPNVELQAEAAGRIIDAMSAAQITEDDGSLLLLCDRPSSRAPTCSAFRGEAPAAVLDPAPSAELWNAFMAVRPADMSPVENVTKLGASHFTHDGARLRFVLTLGSDPR